MKFGKVSDINGINFNLPIDDPSNTEVLKIHQGKALLFIGATAWTTKAWKGKLYPSTISPNNYLEEYGKHFNSIELNSTFYSLPSLNNIKKWKEMVPFDFKFCPKVWKLISHRNDLGLNSGSLENFIDHILQFEDKLGHCFIQLPPYFDFDHLSSLVELMKKWPKGLTLAIEARHESYYLQENFTKYIEACRMYNMVPLITDVAGRRDILHSSLGCDKAVIRWVGNGLHSSDYQRCDEWVERINTWVKEGIKEIYFFTHQPDNILAPEISQYLVSKISIVKNLISRGPRLNDSNNQLSLL